MTNQYLKAPINLQVELTENCNNRCQHCYNFFRYREGTPQKPLAVNMDNLNQIANNIIRNEVFHVTLSGGEPLLIGDKNLEKIIIQYLKGEVQVSLNSNLTCLNDYLVDLFADLGIDILTSLPHSNEEKFNRIVNNKSSYQRTINAIRKLRHKDVRVGVNMVVTKETVKDVYETGKFVASLGCHEFSATRLAPSNMESARHHKQLVLDNQDLLAMLDQLFSLWEDFGLYVATLNPLPLCAVPDPIKYEGILRRRCCAGLTSAGIGINGDLRGCQHLPISYGNLLEEELIELWKKVPAWRDLYQSDTCLGCVEIRRCAGGCRENALVMDGDLKGSDNLEKNGYGQLNHPVLEPILSQIDSIKLNGKIITRPESFGGVLYRNPASYTLVDEFTFNLLPFYHGKDITKKEWLEIGRNFDFVDETYLSKVFNGLVNQGLAVKIN